MRSSLEARRSEPTSCQPVSVSDLVGERPVEVDRVHHHPRQAERAAQLAHEPGGVEGRAARQVGALDEEHVLPPEPRQPVEDGGPADTSADDHRSGPVAHRVTLLGDLWGECPRMKGHEDSPLILVLLTALMLIPTSAGADGYRCSIERLAPFEAQRHPWPAFAT